MLELSCTLQEQDSLVVGQHGPDHGHVDEPETRSPAGTLHGRQCTCVVADTPLCCGRMHSWLGKGWSGGCGVVRWHRAGWWVVGRQLHVPCQLDVL